PGKPAPYQGGEPFNRCTHVALSPKNEIYVSDGYGNSRVHKYSPDGKLLFSWGEPGTDPGQFNIVHNIVADRDGHLYVADRENHRIQVFDGNGKFVDQWHNMHRPCALYMDSGREPLCYLGELGPSMAVNKECPNLGPRLSILSKEGKILARLGDIRPGEAPGQFIAPHGLALDSRGDLYVGEVSWTIAGQHLKPPREMRSLQKLIKRA
ncbi:MAG TPA: peptidyl-alpha-hydroxyglycine alpha-amidating lyase family protein, partial [Candidatus Binatia bacterium]